jgi:hypothetical protein
MRTRLLSRALAVITTTLLVALGLLPSASHGLTLTFTDCAQILIPTCAPPGPGTQVTIINGLPGASTATDRTPVDPAPPTNPFTSDAANIEVITFSFSHPNYLVSGNLANFRDGSIYGLILSDLAVVSLTDALVTGRFDFSDTLFFPPPGIGGASIVGEDANGQLILPNSFAGPPFARFVARTSTPPSNANLALDELANTGSGSRGISVRNEGGLGDPLPPTEGVGTQDIFGFFEFQVRGGSSTIALATRYFVNDAGGPGDPAPVGVPGIVPFAGGAEGIGGGPDILPPPGGPPFAGVFPFIGTEPFLRVPVPEPDTIELFSLAVLASITIGAIGGRRIVSRRG